MEEGVVNADREALGRSVNGVRQWADKTVAHLNRNSGPLVLTWGDLNRSFDTVAGIIDRYEQLFTGVHHIMPPFLPLGWRDPFECALFSRDAETEGA